MHRSAVTSSPALPAFALRGELGVPVGVMILGVRVTAYAVVNMVEHRRREAAGIGAVIHPGLLDRLMDLPVGVSVTDPVVWAETADQPAGVVERGEDGSSVTRRLESPLAITDVVVNAAAGQELRAVQDASLFAGFTRRWVAAARARGARHADYRPDSPDLPRVVAAMYQPAAIGCPELPVKQAQQRWAAYVDCKADLDLLDGDALLHTDFNPLNVLLGSDRVWLVDWAWPTRGAAFIDVFALASARLYKEIAGSDPQPFKQRLAAAAHQWACHRLGTSSSLSPD